MIRIWFDELFLMNEHGDPSVDTKLILTKELAEKFHEELGKYLENYVEGGQLVLNCRGEFKRENYEEFDPDAYGEDPNQIALIKAGGYNK